MSNVIQEIEEAEENLDLKEEEAAVVIPSR